MNNFRARRLRRSFSSNSALTARGSMTYSQLWQSGRATKVEAEIVLFGSSFSPSPYLVSATRWIE